MKNILAGAVLLSLLAVPGNAQSRKGLPPTDELYRAIAKADGQLFDAYNRCELEKFSALVDDGVEFFHDQGGVTLGAKALTESVKKNICGKVRRDLVPDSLEVYPMKGIGALEIGVHRFHHPGHDDTEAVGEGKFVMLWQFKDGGWTVTRVFSFDHYAMDR
jgi:hypothetical protein